jgi:signal peptidase I
MVEGASMQPLLKPGDVVEIDHTRGPLRRGDVVAYRTDQTLVIHRVLRDPVDGCIQVAGDNRTITDEPVPISSVIGRVVAVERDGVPRRLDTPQAQRLGRAITTLHPLKRVPLLGRLVLRVRRALGARLGR